MSLIVNNMEHLLHLIWIFSVIITQNSGINCQLIVDTKYGKVMGESIVLATGSVIDSYLAIPYAKPPVDELRFQAPIEPDPWNDTYIATDLGDACMQSVVNTIHYTHLFWNRYSEDCLHLNIYTPQKDTGVLLPVMVYIHGGGFTGGANVAYPGYFLAEKDVVVVVINYRLDIMGFAFTADDTIPGNAGLLDQIQALKFVQENIENFGGDPGSVTIFGESAGGVCVGLLMMSPLAEGLFHSAILQSGNELASWAVTPAEDNPENSLIEMAEYFDCPTDTSEEMVECLQDINARRLINARLNCTTATYCPGFVPVVDGTIIPDVPLTLRKSGQYNKVPELIGFNKQDAYLFVGLLDFPNVLLRGMNRSVFEDHLWLATSIASERWPDPERQEDVYEAFKFFYTDWPNVEDIESNRMMVGDIYTDLYFGYSTDQQAKYHSQDGNTVYHYVFNHRIENSVFADWMGAFHAVEMSFLYGWSYMTVEGNEMAMNHSQMDPLVTVNYTQYDIEYSNFIMDLWTNFAKYGNPTPSPIIDPNGTEIEWPAFTDHQFMYMDLYKYPTVRQNYRQKEFAFWTEYLNFLIYGEEFIGKPILQSEILNPHQQLPEYVGIDAFFNEDYTNENFETDY